VKRAASCDPVEDQRARRDDQRGPRLLPEARALGAAREQVRQDLHRLAEAHVVGPGSRPRPSARRKASHPRPSRW
jgi:hypothetical protein